MLYTTSGGFYWLDIVDRTVCFYGLLITGALACLVIGWGFGTRKLREYLNETSDIKVGAWGVLYYNALRNKFRHYL